MYNQKSDLRKMCEIMWAVAKHDAWKWLVVAGLFAGGAYGYNQLKKTSTCNQIIENTQKDKSR